MFIVYSAMCWLFRMFILLIVENLSENRCWYLRWLLDGVGYTFPLLLTHFFFLNRMTMAESRMTPRWRGHCFCCMTLFGLLTFLISVENSRRRFTTESEATAVRGGLSLVCWHSFSLSKTALGVSLRKVKAITVRERLSLVCWHSFFLSKEPSAFHYGKWKFPSSQPTARWRRA